MKAATLALALAAGTTLLAAAPAFAHPPYHAPAYGWRAKPVYRHVPYRGPAYVVVPARPVYVVPPPVIYVPPPRPAFYGTIPISPAVQVGVRLRL